MLHGREAESAEIHRVLDTARSGSSAVLTLVGEAGIGKTALLEYAGQAEGFLVLRCTGVETEAELPFAALHLLLRPVLDRLDALPDPQAAALRGAFGLTGDAAPDRFLVGLATLTLLADVASEQPVLCLLDDAQWLDRESAEALLFASRRLYAEGVVVIGATRDPTAPCLDIEQPRSRLVLVGLDHTAAVSLLAERAADLADDVRDRLLGEALGNPLALLELSVAMRGQGGRSPVLPIAVRVSPGESPVQDAFWRQVEELPAATRTALLVAAADDTGDADAVVAAARRLGAGLADLKPAEDAGLVIVTGGTVAFRHPLIRSVTYARSAGSERAGVHRALADEFDRQGQPDRRAWHLAAATTGPDDAVAAELESAADRARARGGYAASSAAYERAARLSVDAADRGRRLAAAAFDARESGQLAAAVALAEEAQRFPSDLAITTDLAHVRARVDFEHGRPGRASDLLVRTAERLAGSDPERAGRVLFEAIRMAYFADRPRSVGEVSAVVDAIGLPDGHPLRSALAAAAVAYRLIAGTPLEELPPVHKVVRALRPERLVGNTAGQAVSLWQLVGNAAESYELTSGMLAETRARGHIGALPHLLLLNAEAALYLGRLREAFSAATEGVRISADTGQEHSAANLRSLVARVAAMTGDERRCVEYAEESVAYGMAHQTGAHVVMANLALCVLDLGLARYESAFERLEQLGPELGGHLVMRVVAPPAYIEAAVRAGRPDRGAEILPQYEMWTSRHLDSPTARAVVQRCRALLSDGDRADEHFRAALRMHRRSGPPVMQARTELVYGEWLRRNRRRTEAKAQLRAALRTFETVGAASWAERARTELRAAGETVSSPADQGELLAQLTPQELQVARLAATGLTNRDIGAQLFLSPRTVGYHLYKVFPKLGISTRADLARLNLG